MQESLIAGTGIFTASVPSDGPSQLSVGASEVPEQVLLLLILHHGEGA